VIITISGTGRIKGWQCQHCSYTSKNKANVRLHVYSHEGIKPFQCGVCGKAFRGNTDLKRHAKSHEDTREYRCDVCGRCFKYRVNMLDHMKKHFSDDHFVCETCGQIFTTRKSLQEHQSVHLDVKTVPCSVCSKVFKTTRERNRHEKIHSAERRFTCEYCPSAFYRKDNFRAHLASKHNVFLQAARRSVVKLPSEAAALFQDDSGSDAGPVKNRCHLCGAEFGRLYDYRRHMLLQHELEVDPNTGEVVVAPGQLVEETTDDDSFQL